MSERKDQQEGQLLNLTDGGRVGGKDGLGRGSSSIGWVEKVNWGVWRYFQSRDYVGGQNRVSLFGCFVTSHEGRCVLTLSSVMPFWISGTSNA